MKFLKILALIGVILLIITAMVVCYIQGHLKPPVPLTMGLQGSWETISAEFDTRVKAQFPLGLSEIDMGKELQLQGFSRHDWNTGGRKGDAIRREGDFVCNKAAYIHWQADTQGRLTSISGEYREEGCL